MLKKQYQLILVGFLLFVCGILQNVVADIIKTIAGTGTTGYYGDGGPATSAQFYHPTGITLDSNGNIYIADQNNHRVRKINTSGIITTIAGTGVSGYSGDGGPATSSQLYYPTGVVLDSTGNIYIADEYNYRVRKIDTSGIITTIAGNGIYGYSGDGGPATSAKLSWVTEVVVDSIGNIYICDYNNDRIRKVDTSGIITTIAGTGTVGYSGDGGSATLAQLNYPFNVVVDLISNIYISDTYNHRIRKIDISGIITTIAGTGTAGYSGDGGSATSAQLNYPNSVAIDSNGNIYITDQYNHCIRKISKSTSAASMSGYISGKIIKTDGTTPIKDVLVEVLQNGIVKSSITTDANGNYTLTLDTGTYWIFTSSIGYISNLSTGVVVNLGQTTTFYIMLSSGDVGLVGYWKFDEGSGSIVYDYSGNNINGTISEAGWVIGKSGKGLSFDGINDKVRLGYSSKIAFNHNSNFSLFAWVKPTNVHQGTIFRLQDPNTTGIFRYWIEVRENNKILAGIEISNQGGYDTFFYSSGTYTLNNWNYIGWTYNGSTKEIRIYINGNLDSISYHNAHGNSTTSSQWNSIGLLERYTEGNIYVPFNGIIDELKIYNYTRTAEQVQQEANSLANNIPTLSWTVETNYSSDGLEPETGMSTTTFMYRVKYTDTDNDTPKSGYPKVHIKKSGVEITGSPFTMNYVSGNNNIGAIYTYSTTLSTGTDYAYYFECYDVWYATATGTPTTPIDAPDVYSVVGTINGKVTKQDGTGIKGALIEAIQLGVVKSSTTSDVNGDYTIVPDTGSYWIFVSSIGYISNLSTGVAVNIGQTTALNVSLSDGKIGLVGYWKFDEGEGSITYDYSGNGNNGIIYGPNWTTGTINSGLNFDGVNDYVNILDSNRLDVTTAFTLEAWIYMSGTGAGDNPILSKYYRGGGGGSPSDVSYILDDNANSRTLRLIVAGQDATPPDVSLVGNTIMNYGQWYHVACVYNGASGTMDVYVNGVKDIATKTTGIPSSVDVNTESVLIGAAKSWGNPSPPYAYIFNGKIDEVRIYNYALTQSEVLTDASKQTGITRGKVTKSDGITGIQGALVEAIQSGVVKSSTTTDLSGNYSITLTTGTYDIRVSTTRYEIHIQINVIVYTSSTTTINFTLNFINNYPALSWSGETNYSSDGLEPETGMSTTTFIYRIKYADIDNDAPKSGYPKVHIKKSGVEITGSPFSMSYVSGNNNTGAIYTYSTTLSSGTDYTYYFEGYDVYNATSVGTPTTPVDAPDVLVPASTTSTSGYISGKITKSDRTTTISGALVEAYNNKIASITLATTYTDTNGNYSLTLSSGTYWVFTSLLGYISKLTTGVIVNSGETTTYNVSLETSPAGLLGYWKFDEGEGNIIFDYSGYKNKGTLTNMNSSDWVTGKVKNALNFDGIDNYVQVGALPDYAKGSISSWIKFAGGSVQIRNSQVPINWGALSGGAYIAIFYDTFFGNKSLLYGIYNHWDWQGDLVDSGIIPEEGKWYYVVGTWDTTGMRFYINGEQKGIVQNYSGPVQYAERGMFGVSNNMNGYFSGLIDEIKVYNRSLSANEILTIYQEEVGMQAGTVSGKITKSDGTTLIKYVLIEVLQNGVVKSSITADSNGNYSLTLSSGTYDIKVSSVGYQTILLTNKTISEGGIVTLNFALNETNVSGKPDLTIVSLISNTTSPVLNETVNANITIKNQSDIAINTPFWLDFYKNLSQPPVLSQPGDWYTAINSLGAGSSITFTTSFVYEGGLYNLYAQVDSDNNINESSETNNIYGPVYVKENIKTGTVKGKVVSKTDGKPISGANIIAILSSSISVSGKTDMMGNYSINTGSGTYTLEVNIAGYKSSSTIVEIIAEKTVYKDFILTPTSGKGILSGIITKIDAVTTIPGVTIKVLHNITGDILYTTQSSFVGTYRFIISSGTYDILVEVNGYKSQTKRIILYEDDSKTEDFKLEYLYIPPEPVADLMVVPLENSSAYLSWTPSVSDNVQYYRIYYSFGALDFNTLFSVVKSTVSNSTRTWISQELLRGETYNFSVRPVNTNGVENLDINNIVRLSPVNTIQNTKAIIKVPQTGKKVSGNRLTVVAEVISNPLNCEKVRFEYKPSYSDKWLTIPIPSGEIRHLNPDSSWPYFIHWNLVDVDDIDSDSNITEDIPNGLYDIRAVAIDKNNNEDTFPVSITISVNSVDFEVAEKITNNLHQKIEKIYNQKDNYIKIGKSDENNLTEIVISSGALNTSTDKLNVTVNPVLPTFSPYAGLSTIVNARDISLESGQKNLNKDIYINIPYEVNNNDKVIVNGKETEKTSDDLEVWSYDEISKLWKKEISTTKDKYNKQIKIKSNHLSIYAVIVNTTADLTKVKIYPSPFKKNEGHTKITFSGLTGKDVTIKIWTISGELVFKQEGIITGDYDWAVVNDKGESIASGIYLYFIKDIEGHKTTGKIGVIK